MRQNKQQAADLTRLKGELETEVNRRISVENQLGSLQQDKEQLESSLRSLTGEHEQLKSAFAVEENRAISVEQELKTVMQAKTQSEQELTLAITGLNETKKQQAADLTRLKGELEDRSEPADLGTENQSESLQQDKEQLESSLRSLTGEHKQVKSAFESEENRATFCRAGT